LERGTIKAFALPLWGQAADKDNGIRSLRQRHRLFYSMVWVYFFAASEAL
jgi:hypothetical protein